MQTYSDTIVDQYGGPVPGVQIAVYESDGVTLAAIDPNPLTTDSSGEFSFTAANGKYVLEISHQNIVAKAKQVVLFDPTDNNFRTIA
jgi:hypothetical protein